ncbi:MAG TPA: hypothetical protein VGZ00_10560, partial [Candidatus Baltobacteraceae bacterium]|nr:hypothetical protein [Candidatus Baltobacteraceae bacterium]
TAATFNTALFAPIVVEIAACDKNVPSLISVVGSFFGFKGGAITISALGTATAVSVEQDWLQPGQIIDPNTNSWYQPDEGYGITQYWDTFNNVEWYYTHFGGNPFNDSQTGHTYTLNVVDPEFSVQTSWWNAIPYPPFLGALTQSQVCP